MTTDETPQTTMLERAKAAAHLQASKGITDQHIEVALAWARDEITYSQALQGFFGRSKSTMQGYIIMARALREAFRRGILK